MLYANEVSYLILNFVVRRTTHIPNRYAPCLSSVFQFEFRDEKQKEFSQRTLIFININNLNYFIPRNIINWNCGQ
jgi:hypothetical protein